MIDLSIDLDALLAHDPAPAQAGANRATCQEYTTLALFGFSDLDAFKRGLYFGGCSPAELAHSSRWDAVSA